MKAIHNDILKDALVTVAVVNIVKSKNESNSQRRAVFRTAATAVVNIVKSKNESNSQQSSRTGSNQERCCKYR